MDNIKTAPKDGTRILVNHTTYGYDRDTDSYQPTGEKWTDCRWVMRSIWGDSHWEEWAGDKNIYSTNEINEEDINGWIPLPIMEGSNHGC